MNKVLVIDPKKLGKVNLLNMNDNNVISKDNGYQIKITEEEYKQLQKSNNELSQKIVVTSKNGEEDICYLNGEKDIKQCTISFAPQKTKTKTRNIILLAINQAFKVLGMETIIVKVEENDSTLIRQLKNYGFESLGDVEGKLTFLKEKEELELGSIVNGNNKKY